LLIVDLTRSFNYQDSTLYSEGLYPSAKGGEIIVNLVDYVMKYHKWNTNQSKLYYLDRQGNIKKNFNMPDFKWNIENGIEEEEEEEEEEELYIYTEYSEYEKSDDDLF